MVASSSTSSERLSETEGSKDENVYHVAEDSERVHVGRRSKPEGGADSLRRHPRHGAFQPGMCRSCSARGRLTDDGET
jgi:hypothetical protein